MAIINSTIELSMPEWFKEFKASNAKSSAHHKEQDTSSTFRKFRQPGFETKMVSAKEKSENRRHHNRSRSSTERVVPWQDHGYFNRSTRSLSFCEDKAWIQKSSEKGKRHKFSCHRQTSAKGGPPVGRRGLRQVPTAMFDVQSDSWLLRPFLESNNFVGV